MIRISTWLYDYSKNIKHEILEKPKKPKSYKFCLIKSS